MKEGDIIMLHKGGRKRRDEPSNYRASILLKVYEMVLIDRCKGNKMTSIRRLQGGFQDGLGCILTSLSLRECLNYSREHLCTCVFWMHAKRLTGCGMMAYFTSCPLSLPVMTPICQPSTLTR
ncbi:hypothetical protein DPMN_032924 [Dreissena polymorpha]|uniref:Uncharacterized protein n=1 Tax=Dreissena polymorpha TaxID=45954 RepID=A0A9D4M5Q0_DREPO|nr:hypothetical protein DPMN_032924 [Dreissena polymorpha]